MDAVPFVTHEPFVIVTLSTTGLAFPASNVIAFAFVALVIVPLVIDHAYVAPGCDGTDAF
jgi:hypothetical protein